MNFFEHQDQARHNTTKLLLLFGLAIALIIAAFYSVALFLVPVSQPGLGTYWRPGLLFWVTSGTLGFMAVGSATKLAQLSNGGHSIAQGLGGRRLDPTTDDPDEQRLINVVSEMALASGTPIPAIYLLDDEPGINAFAAGHTANDAVIGVTRGCLEALNRDELQGVIGHEFSHILNGDMGLNLKLIGVIHGLLLIYIAGRVIWRWTGYPGSVRRSKDSDKSTAAILGAAMAMVVIGYLGVLGGRLIKSAVSREREFLADASAVQYTRNPDGIAGALRKIGQLSAGSAVAAPMAETASHLFFGEANSGLSFLGGWFATHPPLGERLRRLGQVPVPAGEPLGGKSFPTTLGEENGLVMGFQGGAATALRGSASTSSALSPSADQFLTALGTTDAKRLAQVRSLLTDLPPLLKAALHDATAARDVVFALLVRTKPALQAQQIEYLAKTYGPDCKSQVGQFYQYLRALKSGQDLLLVEALVPALNQLDAAPQEQFLKTVKVLSQPGGRLLLTGYTLYLVLQKRLAPLAPATSKPLDSLDTLWGDALNLMSLLAKVGHSRSEDALYAFKLGISQLPGAKKQPSPNELPAVSPAELTSGLGRLGQATPKLKQAIVDACAHTVLADNDVTPAEMSLLRAVVITLDCPAPPFLTS
jgi:Zn-dependent protease with chaperone function